MNSPPTPASHKRPHLLQLTVIILALTTIGLAILAVMHRGDIARLEERHSADLSSAKLESDQLKADAAKLNAQHDEALKAKAIAQQDAKTAQDAMAQAVRESEQHKALSAQASAQAAAAKADAAAARSEAEAATASALASKRIAQIADLLVESFKISDSPTTAKSDTSIVQVLSCMRAELEANPDAQNPLDRAQALELIGVIYLGNGHPRKAREVLATALELTSATSPADSIARATLLERLACATCACGDPANALKLATDAMAMLSRLPTDAASIEPTARTLSTIARAQIALKSYGTAAAALTGALDMFRAFHAGDHRLTATLLELQAKALDGLGKWQESVRIHAESLAMRQRLFKGDHPDIAESMTALVGLQQSLGDAQAALPTAQAVLAMQTRLHPGDNLYVAEALNNLGSIERSLGDPAKAEASFAQALAMKQRCINSDSPLIVQGLTSLAWAKHAQGRLPQAGALMQRALEMQQRLFPGDTAEVANALTNLAWVQLDLGEAKDALRNATAAQAIYEKLAPMGSTPRAVAMAMQARAMKADGQREAAKALIAKAESMVLALEPATASHATTILKVKAEIEGSIPAVPAEPAP